MTVTAEKVTLTKDETSISASRSGEIVALRSAFLGARFQNSQLDRHDDGDRATVSLVFGAGALMRAAGAITAMSGGQAF